jgi:hypothetical protein
MAKPAASPAAAKTRELTVEMPESGFRVILYFNKFGVEKVGENLLIHFGFVSVSGEVMATYSAVLEKRFLSLSRKDWLQYLGQISSPPDQPLEFSWKPPASKIGAVEIINAMRIGRSGSDAELRLYCVSLIAAIDRSRGETGGSKDLVAQPLALLQTTLDQQQLILLTLLKYPEL